MEVCLGLEKAALKEISEALRIFLSSTYALYLKTQNFHWNVISPEFFSLHLLFQKHYEEMANGVDEIAERIRSLGSYVHGSFSSFLAESLIKESNQMISASKMVQELMQDHEEISRLGRPLIRRFQDLHDDVSSDLLIKRLAFHEKAAWMLRSHKAI